MTPLSYSVAAGSAVDSAAVARLLSTCAADLDYLFSDEAQLQRYCEKIVNKAQFFLCVSDESLAGFAAVYCNDFETRTAFLTMICVSSEFRGRGIANILLRMAVDHVRELGFERFVSRVATHNEASLNLHLRLGFEIEQIVDEEAHLSMPL